MYNPEDVSPKPPPYIEIIRNHEGVEHHTFYTSDFTEVLLVIKTYNGRRAAALNSGQYYTVQLLSPSGHRIPTRLFYVGGAVIDEDGAIIHPGRWARKLPNGAIIEWYDLPIVAIGGKASISFSPLWRTIL